MKVSQDQRSMKVKGEKMSLVSKKSKVSKGQRSVKGKNVNDGIKVDSE